MDLDPRLDRNEADLLESVSADELMALTATLTTEVRLSGSPEERRAFEHAAELLHGWGLRTRLLEHPAYISLPGPAMVQIAGIGDLTCITHSFAASTLPDGITGTVIDVGAGTPEDWDRPEVRGTIALINGLATPEQARRAGAAGSIAQIFINDEHLHEMILSRVWGNPTPDQLSNYPHTPVVSVVRADGARIRAALAAGPVEARIQTEVTTEWRTLPLLEAELPGTVESECFVLFSGHIDSWHYGAMDNGGANATMLHLARLFAERRDQLRRGLRICFWSGHSHGRYAGSAWYTDNHWAELMAGCVAHVYIDSVGGKGATLLSEAYCMAETHGLGKAIIARYGEQEFLGSRVGAPAISHSPGSAYPRC
ncbi:MAG: M28 family peptidase [Oscillochloris sp.]|nr:M28 family peptidase [Oscillochloris sp.]